jgi:threonine/homoserine/homoserine lactone efflux protein
MPSSAFFVTSFVVILMPGTGVMYTVSIGLLQGWRASIAAALGCTVGIVPHLLAGVLGVSVLQQQAFLFQGLKFVGVLYLLYLAGTLWRDTHKQADASAQEHERVFRIAYRAILINLLNPKLTVFFLTFLPLFIDAEQAAVRQALLLGGLFMLMTLGVFIAYGVLASRVQRYVTSTRHVIWLQRTVALIFVVLAGQAALT